MSRARGSLIEATLSEQGPFEGGTMRGMNSTALVPGLRGTTGLVDGHVFMLCLRVKALPALRLWTGLVGERSKLRRLQ